MVVEIEINELGRGKRNKMKKEGIKIEERDIGLRRREI